MQGTKLGSAVTWAILGLGALLVAFWLLGNVWLAVRLAQHDPQREASEFLSGAICYGVPSLALLGLGLVLRRLRL